MAADTEEQLQRFKERAREDTAFYAEHCLRIVDKDAELVAFKPKPAQLRLDRALEEQRRAGLPMRVIILKARQIGYSTWVQAKLFQRVTQRANRNAIVIAHDKDTAGELFQKSWVMYHNLPDAPELGLKPPIRNHRSRNSLELGNPNAMVAKGAGIGINSKLTVDTANEFEAGRGMTYTEAHLSEVAQWPNIETKLLGVLSAVPKKPETLVVIESTARGNNYFRDLWDRAKDGKGSFVPFFSPWHEEEEYQKPFLNDQERQDFINTIGEGAYGEDEPLLIEQFNLTPEQLHWRRMMLDEFEIGGDLRKFKQEYPSTDAEAFMTTGAHVFDQMRVQVIVNRTLNETDPKTATETTPGPTLGILKESGTRMQKGRHGLVEVPNGALWVPAEATGFGPRHPYWRVWEEPAEDGRYVVIVDPAEGEEIDRGESDFSAIQVLNHNTRAQVAEYRSRIDADVIAVQAYLAAHYWKNAILAVEKTGPGAAIVRKLYFDFKFPLHLMYRRHQHDSSKEKTGDRLGWSTDRLTKPILVTTGTQVLREAVDSGEDDRLDIVRSRLLADELTSYMRDERGRTAARKGRHDDLLMAWLIGQQVADEMQPLPLRKAGQMVRSVLSSATQDRWMV